MSAYNTKRAENTSPALSSASDNWWSSPEASPKSSPTLHGELAFQTANRSSGRDGAAIPPLSLSQTTGPSNVSASQNTARVVARRRPAPPPPSSKPQAVKHPPVQVNKYEPRRGGETLSILPEVMARAEAVKNSPTHPVAPPRPIEPKPLIRPKLRLKTQESEDSSEGETKLNNENLQALRRKKTKFPQKKTSSETSSPVEDIERDSPMSEDENRQRFPILRENSNVVRPLTNVTQHHEVHYHLYQQTIVHTVAPPPAFTFANATPSFQNNILPPAPPMMPMQSPGLVLGNFSAAASRNMALTQGVSHNLPMRLIENDQSDEDAPPKEAKKSFKDVW